METTPVLGKTTHYDLFLPKLETVSRMILFLTQMFLFINKQSGQEQLTASILATASQSEQKQMIGERLFPLVQEHQPHLAGKITGMLLEIDNTELLHMLDSRDLLQAKVEGAVQVLQARQAKEVQVTQVTKIDCS